MQLKGKIALVTGANGGIGEALVKELLRRGVAKVYAAGRNLQSVAALTRLDPDRVIPLQLDITDAVSVAAAAAQCRDIDLLINNAGCNRGTALMSPMAMAAAREEMNINFFGTLAMCQAFAPVLTSRGGGVIANTCSIIGLVNLPVNGTYCASKAAVHSMLQGLRAELIGHKIEVVGIYPGPVDTPMTAGLEMPKASPQTVAAAIADGIEAGDEEIFPDPMSREVSAMLAQEPKAVEKQFAANLPG